MEMELYEYCSEEDVENIEAIILCWSLADAGEQLFNDALIVAVENGNVKVVDVLLNYGDKIDFSKLSSIPLNLACWNGHLEIVCKLLDAGLDVEKRDANGRGPLNYAIYRNHMEIVEFLLQNNANTSQYRKLNYRNVLKYFPCVLNGKFDDNFWNLSKLLINRKVIRPTAFLTLAVLERDSRLLKLLLQLQNIDVNCKIESKNEYDGMPLLCAACEMENYEIAKMLIDHGANVENRQYPFYGPIYYALLKRCVNIVKLLLKNGATCLYPQEDITECALLRREYFDYKFDRRSFAVVKSLIEYKQIRSLQLLCLCAINQRHEGLLKVLIHEGGVDVNSKFCKLGLTCEGQTFLQRACAQDNEKLVKILLKSGADPNVSGENELTPLMLTDNLSIMKILLENGADINARSADGQTALHLCHIEKNMTFLISRGIDVLAKDNENNNARDFFINRYDQDVNNGDKLAAAYNVNMKEISKMKRTLLNRYGLNLHEILLMNTRKLTRYVSNIKLKRITESPRFFKNFPIFGKRIKEKIREGQRTKMLMDRASKSLSNISQIKIEKLHWMIFKYLSDSDMKSLSLADGCPRRANAASVLTLTN